MVSARRVAAPPMVAVARAGAQARELAATWSVLDGGLAAGAQLWRQEPFRRVMDRSDGMDDLEQALAEGADIRETVPGLASLLQAVEALEPPPTPLSEQRLPGSGFPQAIYIRLLGRENCLAGWALAIPRSWQGWGGPWPWRALGAT